MAARVLAFEPSQPAPGARVRMSPVVSHAQAPLRTDWPGDERAVTRFLAGDVSGFEQIVQHYSSALFALAARLVGPAEAEDVVQETFLRAYRGLERFRGESSLKTWLYAIAINRARVRYGTLARLRSLFTSGPRGRDSDDLVSLIDDAPDPGASPEEASMRRQQRSRLRAAMRGLPEEFRAAVVLRDLQGLSYAEISDVLRVPIGTVRSRIARGRALLREELA